MKNVRTRHRNFHVTYPDGDQPVRSPVPAIADQLPQEPPNRLKVPKGATSLQAIARILDDPTAHGLTRVPGRTLPKNHQWFGHDIPGRGGAAARRLRQQAKLAAKKGT